MAAVHAMVDLHPKIRTLLADTLPEDEIVVEICAIMKELLQTGLVFKLGEDHCKFAF